MYECDSAEFWVGEINWCTVKQKKEDVLLSEKIRAINNGMPERGLIVQLSLSQPTTFIKLFQCSRYAPINLIFYNIF